MSEGEERRRGDEDGEVIRASEWNLSVVLTVSAPPLALRGDESHDAAETRRVHDIMENLFQKCECLFLSFFFKSSVVFSF